MKRKSILWTITGMMICAMALFGFAGCGSSSDEYPEEETVTVAQTTTEETTEPPKAIGEEAALEIALKDAGFKESEVSYVSVQFGEDDGVTEYDVDFKKDNKEYDYTIEAFNGEILEKEIEADID